MHADPDFISLLRARGVYRFSSRQAVSAARSRLNRDFSETARHRDEIVRKERENRRDCPFLQLPRTFDHVPLSRTLPRFFIVRLSSRDIHGDIHGTPSDNGIIDNRYLRRNGARETKILVEEIIYEKTDIPRINFAKDFIDAPGTKLH